MKKTLLIGIIVIIVIGITGVAFFYGLTGPSYKTYTNQYMSFQYPAGWNVEEISMGSVNIYKGSKGDVNGEYFTVTPYGKTNGKIFRFINEFFRENTSVDQNTDPSMIQTGNINGGTYTFYGNHSNKTINRQFLFFYNNGTGVILSGNIKDPSVLVRVIDTFNLT